MSVITLDQFQIYQGGTVDSDRAELVINAVNDYVDSVTSRCWGATTSVTGEVHDGCSVVFLNHQDVHEVSEVVIGRGAGETWTLDAENYFCNPLGRLSIYNGVTSFAALPDYISVSYTYGTVDVPYDLCLAALALASGYYDFAENGGHEISEEGVGSYRLRYASDPEKGIAAEHRATISRYATRRA